MDPMEQPEPEIAGHYYALQVSARGWISMGGGMVGFVVFGGVFDASRVLVVFVCGAGGLLLPDGLLQRPDEPTAPDERVLHGQQQRCQAGLRDGPVVIWRDGGGTTV